MFPTSPRFDLNSSIHKALRLLMGDALTRVGRLDSEDSVELADTLARVGALLDALRAHLARENICLHPAIEARHPSASQRIAALEAETAALRARPSAAAALRLYRQLALLVAASLEHMHVEETQHNELSWDACSDAELAEFDQRTLALIEPAEMTALLALTASAISPAERVAMFGAMQQQMPPEAMRDVLEAVRRHLDDTAWGKLARALRIPNAPGLVSA